MPARDLGGALPLSAFKSTCSPREANKLILEVTIPVSHSSAQGFHSELALSQVRDAKQMGIAKDCIKSETLLRNETSELRSLCTQGINADKMRY